MISFFQRKRDTLGGVIIDIGSGSVAASILLSRYGKELPEIIYMHREFMPVKSASAPTERIRSMRRTLFSVMLELEQRGMPVLRRRGKRLRVERILVSCTAPWTHTITQIIHFAREKPFIVTPYLIGEVIARAYDEEEARTDVASLLKDKGQHIVEKSVIDVALNGYSMPDPYNKEALELTIAHLRGLVPTHILTALEDIKKHIQSFSDVRIHTSALIIYCVLRDLYPQTKSALIINVSGEATEATLVQDSILYESIAVAHGMNSVVRDVASLSKTIPEEARSYLRAYKQDVLTETQEKALLRAQKKYATALETALAALAARYVLPRTIFLILDQDARQFFTDIIENAVSDKEGPSQKTIISFAPETSHVLVAAPSDIVIDPRLAITARFFHKLRACGDIDNDR